MASDVSPDQWRKTALAAMANYIDAGSIVAGAVALPLWAKQFGFGSDFVSLLGAMSSNAISAGIGALIGGRICDRFGRKKIYQYDLLLYSFGALWIIFAQAPWVLLLGYFVVGLTVGADVPASWTLITETAPAKLRGRLAGLAQVLWYVGAIAPLILGIALLGLGDWMPRILFAQLFVVALITWALRQGMVESELWARAQERAQGAAGAFRELFRKRHVRTGPTTRCRRSGSCPPRSPSARSTCRSSTASAAAGCSCGQACCRSSASSRSSSSTSASSPR